MILKKTTRHAVCAAVYLARHDSDRSVPAREIAEARRIPAAYLPRILGRMARAGLLESSRGGTEPGFRLARPPEEVSLYEILGIFEQWTADECLLKPYASPPQCPAAHCWSRIRDEMFRPLKEHSLKDLCQAECMSPCLSATKGEGKRSFTAEAKSTDE